MTTWDIDASAVGQRLDLFFVGKQPDFSRSAVQRLIKQGTIQVNGITVTPHHFLKKGDKIKWRETPSNAAPRPIKHRKTHANQPSDSVSHALHIIKETTNWLVIDKPTGLLVHPNPKTHAATLVDLLIAHEPIIAKVGGNPERPGIVHRLDREVSGLMIVAKTESAFDALKRQFASRKVKKTYLALVRGGFTRDEGDIKFRIARAASKARMAARPKHEAAGRAAWTHYMVKERFAGATLLELEILSGRTHQIRAHLFALGHPVIGDMLYTLRRTERKLVAPRLMLQSVGLEFTDPISGALEGFRLPPDPAFLELIEKLRR